MAVDRSGGRRGVVIAQNDGSEERSGSTQQLFTQENVMRDSIVKHVTTFALVSTIAAASVTPSLAQYGDAGVPTPSNPAFSDPPVAGPVPAAPEYYAAPGDGDWHCNCVGRGQLVRSF